MEEVRAVVTDDGIKCNNCHQSLNRRNQDSSHSCDNIQGGVEDDDLYCLSTIRPNHIIFLLINSLNLTAHYYNF